MPLLRRATEQTQSDWRLIPEGVARFVIGKPELVPPDKYGWQVRFPLTLTPAEQERVLEEQGKPPDGINQSYRANYKMGLSLGYVQRRDGQYKSTKLIDMLAAAVGSSNSKKFREWIAGGGGPARPTDLDDDKAEMELIGSWLEWWEGLEVYGTIRHQDSADGLTTYANFAGPMAIGSLPGDKDNDYQAHARGKLRAMIAENGETREEKSRQQRGLEVAEKNFERFTPDGKPVMTSGPDDDELPF